MAKWIFKIIVILYFPYVLFAQDESTPQSYIIREINSENKIISYLEIRDSALAIIDLLKEKWGDVEEVNGKITWNNVSIDSIEAKIHIELYHGFLKNNNFKLVPLSKKEKADDKCVLRLRFMQKDKDLLSSMQTALILKNYFNRLLEEVFEGEKEEDDSD